MVDREHVWEVTTAHGTRIVLDRGEESRWMRIPAIGELAREDIHAVAGCRLMAKAYAAVSVRSLAATAQLAASSSCAPRCGWSRSLR